MFLCDYFSKYTIKDSDHAKIYQLVCQTNNVKWVNSYNNYVYVFNVYWIFFEIKISILHIALLQSFSI
jgi:hypothetical protein